MFSQGYFNTRGEYVFTKWGNFVCALLLTGLIVGALVPVAAVVFGVGLIVGWW